MQGDWVPMQKDCDPMQKQTLRYIEAAHCLKTMKFKFQVSILFVKYWSQNLYQKEFHDIALILLVYFIPFCKKSS